MMEDYDFDWIWDSTDSDNHAMSNSNSSSKLELEIHGTIDQTPDLAEQCASNLVSSLNSYNSEILWSDLRKTCTPDVKISKRVYSLSDPHMREKGLQDTCFKSIEEFVCFMEVWNAFIPDGVFSATNHQTIVACFPTLVFISKLHFTGRKVRTMNFFLEERLESYYPYLPQIVIGHGSDRPIAIRIEGSMTIFVNEVGLINKIEFYLTEF